MGILFLVLGLIIGSYCNVIIARYADDSYKNSKRSLCPKCKEIIAWYDNVPLVSYLLLKGKCRKCNERISIRYPFVETLNALIYLAIYFRLDLSIGLILICALSSLLMCITFIDIDHMVIPNRFVAIIFILGILRLFLTNELTISSALYGGLIGYGFFSNHCSTYRCNGRRRCKANGSCRFLAGFC